jgi:hypothetical protein
LCCRVGCCQQPTLIIEHRLVECLDVTALLI